MKKLIFILLILIFLSNATSAFAQQWFFLMNGAAGGSSTDVYVVVGPFKDIDTCIKLNRWAKEQHSRNKVSICWRSL